MIDDISKLLTNRYLNSIQFSLRMGIAPEDFKSLMQTIGKTKEELESEWIRDHPQFDTNFKVNNWYVDDAIGESAIYVCDSDVIGHMYEELWLGIKHNIDCKGFRNRDKK
jgi:hypothetical protein